MIAGAPFYSIFAFQNDRMSAQQYKSMQELAEELSQYLAAIGEGTGDVDRLQEMVENARELYERLVVMRHKAFEDVANESEEEVEEKSAPEPEEEESVEQPSEDIQEAIPFSIDIAPEAESMSIEPEQIDPRADRFVYTDDDVKGLTVTLPKKETEANLVAESEEEPEHKPQPELESPVVSENQTSLIDAIEEINGESLVDKYASEDDSESLVEKLEKAPIEDLVSAISLNQKFQFIRELFDGDNERYLAEIESFNSMDSWNSAKNVLGSLEKELGWEDGEVLEEFTELIQRRQSS